MNKNKPPNSGKFRKQFRKTNDKQNKKHPAYIYAKVGDEYKFLGITHAKITYGIENITLEKNPNPKDSRVAYVRPNADKSNRSTFGKGLNDWRLTSNDTKTVNKLIEENEKPKNKSPCKRT